MNEAEIINKIRWLGHGSFVITGPPLIYINPWRVARGTFHADAILISHDNYDHCSAADIEKLRGPDTLVLGNDTVKAQIHETQVIRPWQSVTIDRAGIKGIPAYSINSPRFPKEAGALGFLISMDFYDIYYAGNTEITPEFDRIQPDIALLPINGDGTLSVDCAVVAVTKLKPRWTIPYQWGSAGNITTRLDAIAFQERVGSNSTVIIMDPS